MRNMHWLKSRIFPDNLHGCTQPSSFTGNSQFDTLRMVPLLIGSCYISLRRPYYNKVTEEPNFVFPCHPLILDDIEPLSLTAGNHCPCLRTSDLRPGHHGKHDVLPIHTMHQSETVRKPAASYSFM